MLDQGLRTLFAEPRAGRPAPGSDLADTTLSVAETRTSIALMRVNHAGEVAAQALYLGQALFAKTSAARTHLLQAAAEEHDHLAWCSQRLDELGGRRSYLAPFWFLGGNLIGMAAAAAGDRASLGFVSETEKQVEAHLTDHLDRLPPADAKSRAILERMKQDEIRHGAMADQAGAKILPAPIPQLMAVGGGLLRRIALIL